MDDNALVPAGNLKAMSNSALTAYINARHGALCARSAVVMTNLRLCQEDVLEIGRGCLEMQERLGHGSWLDYLKENFAFDRTTAWRWMQKAKEHAANLENVAVQHLTADSVDRLTIAAPEPEEAEESSEDEIGAGQPLADDPEADSAGEQYEPAPAEASPDVPTAITLEAWNALSKAARKKLLATPGTGRFNDQKDKDNIEWAGWSWNPVTGCLHDCPYCYARDIAEELYPQKFAPAFWPGRLADPANTSFSSGKAAAASAYKNVFTCSMADLFGRWVPAEWIAAVLDAVKAAPQWNFLFLTKFPRRYAEFSPFPDNAWIGTTVDCQARVKNAEAAFASVQASVKWLSVEPMIEPLEFTRLNLFNWIVLGGASASTQTPEWRVPWEWWSPLKQTALRNGLQVYEKTNLYYRERSFPGVPRDVPEKAPEALHYLKRKTKDDLLHGEAS